MAQQNTSNVESPIAQSVVHSTTGDDASKTTTYLTSGDNSSEQTTNKQSNRLDALPNRNQVGDGGRKEIDTQKFDDDTNTTTTGVSGLEARDSSGTVSPAKTVTAEGESKTTLKPTPIKKPQSFKAVSITRNFLEKTTHTPVPQSSSKLIFTTEKSSQSSAGGSSMLSSAKPRLVAKSTTGLRDSSPGHGTGVGGSKNLADAGRAVWNKNQPPPVIPVKELSDEELKRTYGIHLASRLQSDEGTGTTETKWADEDDDDDWVPETIEWNDGTKVELHSEPPAPVVAAPISEPAPAVTPAAASISTPIIQEAAKPITEPTVPAPVEVGSGRKMLSLSRDSRKNSELAAAEKAQAKDTPPVRASPWATVAPVQPVPLGPSRIEPKPSDHNVSQHARTSSREVPTDEYNRPWRDRQAYSHELYNSETGQLEPVHDGRSRGPRELRPEMKYNKAQVLQRPLGYAEPSAAFQQGRTGIFRQDDFRRRRTSSNVSGGSGSTGRRLSFNKGMHNLDHPLTPDETTFTARPAFHQNPETGNLNTETADSSGPQTIKQGTSASESAPQAELIKQPLVEFEDPVAIQQAIMKDAREKARKRKQEEEEREEAAKRERLKAKLEVLERQAAEKAAKEAAEKEKQEAEAKAVAAEKAKAEAEAEAARLASLEDAAAKAPIETNTGNSQQASNISPTGMATSSQNPVYPQQHRQSAYNGRSPIRSFSGPNSAELPRSPVKTYVLPANRDSKDSQWKNSAPQNDRYNSWGNNKSQPSNTRSSPWGPIGDKSRYPALDGVRNGSLDTPHHAYSQTDSQGSSVQKLTKPIDSTQPSDVSKGTPDSAQASPLRPNPLPVHISPTNSNHPMHSSQHNEARTQALRQWAAYPAQLQKAEAEERLGRKHSSNEELQARPVELPVIPDTWRKADVVADDRGLHQILTDQPSIIASQPQVTNGHSGYRMSPKDGIHSPNIPTGPSSTRQTSRFFPGPQSQLLQSSLPQVPEDSAIARLRAQASPPPPTCPVNDVHGDRPIPSVRLPPTIHTGRVSPPPRSGGSQKAETPRSPRVSGVGEIEAVQQNIQAMLQKKKDQPQSPSKSFGTPVKAREFPIASSTIPMYDEGRQLPNSRRPAAVTLPPNSAETSPSRPKFIDLHPQDASTKPNEEEFLENLYVQDFGSQPTVKLPNVSPRTPFIPALPPITPKGKQASRGKLLVNSIPILDYFSTKDFTREGSRFIPVRLPDSLTIKEIPFNFPSTPQTRPKKSTPNNTNRNKRGGGSYSRDGQLGGYGGNGRGSYRAGQGRNIADAA